METIIAALISAGAAIVVCIINQNKQAVKMEASLERYAEVTNLKIDELSKRVDKHNNVIERTYKLEELTAVQDEQIKVANHRIEDLENLERRRE